MISMAPPAPALTALLLISKALGQQVCTSTPEVHPSLTWQQCSSGGNCSPKSGSVVIDANWRWTHAYPTGSNCYTGNTWNSALCPDDKTCAKNCCVDGANYQSTYGVTTSQDSLSIGFVTGQNVGSRLYLMASDTKYQMFNLLGNEFTFDVDVSQLGCGLNGALYFVSMDEDGGQSKYPSNLAGAKYGTGYCDSQCPRDLKFINGMANVEGWVPASNNPNTGTGGHGSCCSEMDIWEANSMAQALTPHPCKTVGQEMCLGDDCGGTYSGSRYGPNCDPDGCDWNPARVGNRTFYGKGGQFTIDTTKKVTVVTQFHPDGSMDRFYVQNGVKFAQPKASNVPGYTGNTLNSAYCAAEEAAFGGTSFTDKGGLSQMSKALAGPMVLVLSLWDDYYASMEWLDATYPAGSSKAGSYRGSCATGSGDPKSVESGQGNAKVIFSNIRFGPIGSTSPGSPGSGGNPPTSTTSSPPTSTSPSGAAQTHYGQCGGQGWNGPTQCASPYTCQVLNAYYSQCV